MKLGIVQMQVNESVPENLDTALEYTKAMAGAGAEIVVLPEMFLCPYNNKSFVQNACEADGETVRKLSECARQCNVVLIAGSIPERSDGRIYNTSFVFSDSGELLARHRKIHLFDIDIKGGQRFCESDTLSAGAQITVFDTPFGRIGLCICFDMRFPELCRAMANRGAQIIIAPAAFNMTTGPMHWELMFRARAVDNQVFTAGVAPAQNANSEYKSYGHSILVSPWGKVVRMAELGETAFIADIDLSEITQVREQLPLITALRYDIYK